VGFFRREPLYGIPWRRSNALPRSCSEVGEIMVACIRSMPLVSPLFSEGYLSLLAAVDRHPRIAMRQFEIERPRPLRPPALRCEPSAGEIVARALSTCLEESAIGDSCARADIGCTQAGVPAGIVPFRVSNLANSISVRWVSLPELFRCSPGAELPGRKGTGLSEFLCQVQSPVPPSCTPKRRDPVMISGKVYINVCKL
jgi:hypothetical protein